MKHITIGGEDYIVTIDEPARMVAIRDIEYELMAKVTINKVSGEVIQQQLKLWKRRWIAV